MYLDREKLGFRPIRSPLSKAALAPLAKTVTHIQFDQPLSEHEYRQVAELLKRHPKVYLRIYDLFDSRISNLEFLRFFPELRGISIDLYRLKNFDGLRYLPSDLEVLGLGRFKTSSFSLNSIARFKRLKMLSLDGMKKDIEVISTFSMLKRLWLTSFRLNSLKLLEPLTNLQELGLMLGSVSSLERLPRFQSLTNLSIRQVRGVRQLSCLQDMTELHKMWLQNLPYVRQFPDLRRLTRLKNVRLEGLKNLKDVRGLSRAKNLRQLRLIGLRSLPPKTLACFIGHPVARRIEFGLGSLDANREAYRALGRASEIKRYDAWISRCRSRARMPGE